MKRPLKAPTEPITDEQLELLPYPVYGSPKLDGHRCLIDGIPKTSSMKPQPNPFVQSELAYPELDGLDGELIIGPPNSPDAFRNTDGFLRRHYGEPDFRFYVFDSFLSQSLPYHVRWFYNKWLHVHPRVVVLTQVLLQNPAAVLQYEQACLQAGYEGAMIRTASGLYKQGRATLREMNIFKRKPFVDTEGVIVGFTEQQTNLNPAFESELGLTKRSKCQENMVGAGTLGNFIVQAKEWKKPFACGGGKLDHEERQYIWDHREDYLGEFITFKYQKHGSKDAPRSPIFLRFYKEM